MGRERVGKSAVNQGELVSGKVVGQYERVSKEAVNKRG